MKANELEKALEKQIEKVEPLLEEELEEKGIQLNDDHSSIKYINWNSFITYFLSLYTIIYTDINILYVYCNNVYNELTDNTLLRLVRNLLHRLVPDSWKWTYENVVLSTIKLATLKVSDFNQDMKRLNLLNGIWNLEKEQLFNHRSTLHTSNQLPITYDENADCPKFKKFLKSIFGKDKKRIKLLQEIMGYCLTNSVAAQKAFIFLGSGANGKSVILSILIKLVGADNVSTLPLSDFESSFRRRMLVGKKLNVVSEGEFRSNGVKNDLSHHRGVISMARTSMPNSASSQFFICHADALFLDGAYAAFGVLVNGFETLDKIATTPTLPGDRPVNDQVIKTINKIR